MRAQVCEVCEFIHPILRASRLQVAGAWVHALEDVLVVELEGPAAEVQVTLWTFSGCNGPPRPPVSPSTKEDGKPVTKTTGATSDRLPSQVTAWRHFLRAARGNGWPFQAPHFPVRWFGFSASTVSESGAGVFEDAEAMGSCGGLRGPCARGMWHTQKRLGRTPKSLTEAEFPA
ncbi:unnamed protein product [Effrenium voratum]|nr:unnamed protein product [Effrenium voratum]